MATSDSKVRSIIDFLSKLRSRVDHLQSLSFESFTDLSVHIKAFPISMLILDSQQCDEVSSNAIFLWNWCNKHESDAQELESKGVAAKIRTFSYLVLASISSVRSMSSSTEIKVFESALTAIESCLMASELELAHKLFENESEKRAFLLKKYTNEPDHQAWKRAAMRYDCLRITLEWKRGRLDLAEHFYISGLEINFPSDAPVPHVIIDLLYEIGSSELAMKHFSTAVAWLGRARGLLDNNSHDEDDFDSSEFRLLISHAYVRSLLSLEYLPSRTEAYAILDDIGREHGQKLSVIVLQLESYSDPRGRNEERFITALNAAINSVHLIDANHKLILHYIHQLRELSIARALQCLHTYIVNRLALHGNMDWMENCIVTYIWFATSNAECLAVIQTYQTTIWDDFQMPAFEPFGTGAVRICHFLLWKAIEEVEPEIDSPSVIYWCQVALHPLFKNAEGEDLGRFERKLISCYLQLSNLPEAQAVLDQMPSDRRQHKLTRYLAYCVTTRLNKNDASSATLVSVASLGPEDIQLLFAYVGEAMKHGSNIAVARLLQRILDKDLDLVSSEIDICALLRCTVRSLLAVVAENNFDPFSNDEPLNRLCGVFKTAVSISANVHKNARSKIPPDELTWFRNSSYNIALQHLQTWPGRYVIDLLQYSAQLASASNVNWTDAHAMSNKLHELEVAFIQAVIYAIEARRHDNSHIPKTSFGGGAKPGGPEIRKLLYQNVFNRFTQLQKATSDTWDPQVRECIRWKACKLVPLAFESLLYMNAEVFMTNGQMTFDELSLVHLIESTVQLGAPARTYALIADMILSSASGDGLRMSNAREEKTTLIPLSSATLLLGKIVQIWRDQQIYNIAHAARWIRCIIQLVLERVQKASEPCSNMGSDSSQRNLQILQTVVDNSLSLAQMALEHRNVSKSQEKNPNHNQRVESTTSPGPDLQSPEVYPPEELEWISTSIFNMAVDLYIIGKESMAKEWMAKAIELAELLPLYDTTCNEYEDSYEKREHGMLARTLRNNVSTLGWHFDESGSKDLTHSSSK